MGWEIALILTFVGIAFALFYAGQSLDKEHYPLKLLFLIIGLFLLLTNFAMTTHIINANNATIDDANITSAIIGTTDAVYSGFIWVVILAIVYFVIYFILKIMNSIKLKKEE
jgi:divalent metal cation (Fe/Co/Zn/Cd) transporter